MAIDITVTPVLCTSRTVPRNSIEVGKDAASAKPPEVQMISLFQAYQTRSRESPDTKDFRKRSRLRDGPVPFVQIHLQIPARRVSFMAQVGSTIARASLLFV